MGLLNPRPRANQPTPPKPFDPRDPSTWNWNTSPQPTEAVGKVGYVVPKTNVRPAWSNDPDYKSAIAGQTPIRPLTAQERAVRDAYEAYNEARNRRVIGDDIGAAPGILLDLAYRHGIKYPAESMQRTVTGNNAASYLDPRGGLRLDQRLAGVGEDALNIASIVPLARAGIEAIRIPLMARAVTRGIAQGEAAELALRQQWRAYDDAFASYKVREDAWRSSPEGLAAEAKAKAAHEARHGNKGPFPPRPPAMYREEGGAPKPPAQSRPVNRPSRSELYDLAQRQARDAYEVLDWSIPPARILQPPPPVDPENTVRVWHTSQQGDRLPERLNPISVYDDPATVFSERRGSPHGNLLSSGLYGTQSQVISGSYGRPTQVTYGTGYEKFGSYIPEPNPRKSILPEEREILSRRKDINSRISDFDELKINPYNPSASNLLYRGRFERPLQVSPAYSVHPDSGIIDEADLDISKWNFGGKDPSEITIKDLLNAAPNEQAARAVVMALRDPIVSTQGRTTLKYPLWRNPGTADKTRFAMTSEDVPSYLIENQPFNFWDHDLKGSTSQLYVRRENGEVYMYIPQRYTPGRSANTLPGLFDRGTPSGRPIISETPPGQNYFDLPITHNPDGSIATVGGMKAYDIGGPWSPERANEVADSTIRFMKQHGVDEKSYEPIIETLRREPRAVQDGVLGPSFTRDQDALHIWTQVQRSIDSRIPNGKQKWYQWLRDDAGIEVLPHPGGITVGDSPHQSYVFNAPEKLPPSGYIKPEAVDADQIYAQRMNDYTNALVKMDRYRPRASVPYRLPPSRPAADFLNQAFAGYAARAMAQRPQNRNSPR
jgi:hypothetical protein